MATSAPRGSVRDDPLARGLILGLLLANTVFQKLAIPGTGGALPLSLLLTAGLLALGVALGRLHPVATLALALIPTVGALVIVAGLSPATSVSLSALALVVALLVPYAFALRPGMLDPAFGARMFGRLAAGLAVLGILQFFAQFVLGPEIAFYLDLALSPDLMLAGFNNLNELSYQAGIYKANGVVLLEAAFLNQFLCVAILIELITTRRLAHLALYGAGVLVTYSGTGLLMLAAIAPAFILRKGYLGPALAAVPLLLIFLLFANNLGVGTFLDRADEFSSDQSSAFARFFSIFYLLEQFVWIDPLTTLVGRGPGSVGENFLNVSYSAFDPSWGKIMYEYGVIGFVAYFAFLGFCVLRSDGSGYLKAGLLLQFMFLGGYVSTTPVHIEIWTLLVWPTIASSAGQRVAVRSRQPSFTPAGRLA